MRNWVLPAALTTSIKNVNELFRRENEWRRVGHIVLRET